MVSAKLKRDLESAFNDLSNTSVDINLYSGQLLNVAFDIFTADTFIAGIAEKILSGNSINKKDRIILAKPLVLETIFWVCNNGETFDLRKDLQLFELASKVETVRQLCAKITE